MWGCYKYAYGPEETPAKVSGEQEGAFSHLTLSSDTPADLIARSAKCLVLDLNQQQFPENRFDVITLLETLEYIHDPGPLLAWCRRSASQLVFTYHLFGGEPLHQRRQQGWFNDLDLGTLTGLLAESGWQIQQKSTVLDAEVFVCQ